jgi:hypothetical protein
MIFLNLSTPIPGNVSLPSPSQSPCTQHSHSQYTFYILYNRISAFNNLLNLYYIQTCSLTYLQWMVSRKYVPSTRETPKVVKHSLIRTLTRIHSHRAALCQGHIAQTRTDHGTLSLNRCFVQAVPGNSSYSTELQV